MTYPSAQTDSFVQDRMPARDAWPQMRYDLPEMQVPEQANVVTDLFGAVLDKGWGQRPFLRSPHRVLTYAEGADEVARMAELMINGLGLKPGNRVLLRGGNSIGMALGWLAVVKAGLIVVATMPLFRAAELRKVIDKAEPALALCEAGLLDEMEIAVGNRFPVLAFGDPHEPNSLAAQSATYSSDYPGCATSADDVALLAFTSGTTGKPKACVTTHREILASCNGWPRHILKANENDVVAGSPPLAFTFGTGGLLIFPMWAGASVYFPGRRYKPEAMVREMRDQGITICYTAPTLYRQMAPFAEALGIPSLRICVSAGEALPNTTRELWKRSTGIEMLDGIGGTEMWHIYVSAAGGNVRAGAIGKVVPGYRAKIVNDDGQEVPRGTVGRLAVVGPTGCRYMDDPRQTEYVQNGWNLPGDSFYEDDDGYFYYQARNDDMIVTSGYNVGGPEVEDCLLQHPAVAACGVVGKPDAARGSIIKAFVVLRPGHEKSAATVKALQDFVKQTVAPYKYPREIVFVDDLPRTQTGKLQRYRLRQMA